MFMGDLSNALTPRIFAHVDTVTTKSEPKGNRVTRFVRGLFGYADTGRDIDPRALTVFWQFSSRAGVTMELFSFPEDGLSQDQMDDLVSQMDEMRAHPFRRGHVFESAHEFVSMLPDRQDIIRVIDTPERGLRYGSRWLDIHQAG